MPVYCYRRQDNGEIEELVMSVSELIEKQGPNGEIQLSDGTLGVRDFSVQNTSFPSPKYPRTSASLGVQPSQREEAYAESVRIGVPTDFNVEGDAVFTSMKHIEKYIKASGLDQPQKLCEGEGT